MRKASSWFLVTWFGISGAAFAQSDTFCTVQVSGGYAADVKDHSPEGEVVLRPTPASALELYRDLWLAPSPHVLGSICSSSCTLGGKLSDTVSPTDGEKQQTYGFYCTWTNYTEPPAPGVPTCASTFSQNCTRGSAQCDGAVFCVTPAVSELQLRNVRDLEPWDKISQASGKAANSDLVVVVQSNTGVPLANKTVTISLAVAEESGGHNHHDDTRPVGSLSGGTSIDAYTMRGMTNSQGQFKFTYTAPEVAGSYIMSATCTGCVTTATRGFSVRVPGLVPMPNSPNYVLIGSTATHRSNHYLQSDALRTADKLAERWKLLYPQSPLLHYNDASLHLGGVFDFSTSKVWRPPHSEHRRGVALDVRARRDSTSIPVSLYAAFQDMVKDIFGSDPHYEARVTSASGVILKEEHYHLRLPGVCEYPCKGPGIDSQ
jgi:hypothetical protein